MVTRRPYRSHKVPACSTCRQRKIRCQVDDSALACQYCRRRHLDCNHGMNREDGAAFDNVSRPPPAKRARRASARSENEGSPNGNADLFGQDVSGMTYETDETSPVMVNPSMAEDVEILERHLATQNDSGLSETRPYLRLCSADGDSIVYRTVARRRRGLQTSSIPGSSQLEIVENVLGSFKIEVLKLYAACESNVRVIARLDSDSTQIF